MVFLPTVYPFLVIGAASRLFFCHNSSWIALFLCRSSSVASYYFPQRSRRYRQRYLVGSLTRFSELWVIIFERAFCPTVTPSLSTHPLPTHRLFNLVEGQTNWTTMRSENVIFFLLNACFFILISKLWSLHEAHLCALSSPFLHSFVFQLLLCFASLLCAFFLFSFCVATHLSLGKTVDLKWWSKLLFLSKMIQ